jgi:hypothetical protein
MKNSLQAAMDKITNDVTLKEKELPRPAPITSQQISTRKGTVLIGAHVLPRVQKQLKILAAEEEQTQQELIKEALHLLFTKYGKDTHNL